MIKPIRFAETADDLLKEMDFYGIEEALVYHFRQRDDSPIVGNKILLREIEGVHRLHGTLAILPPQTGELGSLEDLLELMRVKNIRAFRAFPSEHKYQRSKEPIMTPTAMLSNYKCEFRSVGQYLFDQVPSRDAAARLIYRNKERNIPFNHQFIQRA